MIALRRLDHVCLRVADLDEAARRWALEFGLSERSRSGARVGLACDDEALALELEAGGEPGFDHVAFGLARGCSLADARAHLDALGIAATLEDGRLAFEDLEGNAIHLVEYRAPASRLVAHARPAGTLPVGHPRKLGHVNFLTTGAHAQAAFYVDALGLRVSDWLGAAGVWLHLGAEHHVMALVEQGAAHFHHLAFDVVDVGQLRVALDHLGRHGRWLGWGPTRHGVGGNLAAYVRIVEEPCFVELYCDMELLEPDHEPRCWPDDRHSSNTWGPLPPRSYFRFDAVAVASERESLEAQGVPLPAPGSARIPDGRTLA